MTCAINTQRHLAEIPELVATNALSQVSTNKHPQHNPYHALAVMSTQRTRNVTLFSKTNFQHKNVHEAISDSS